MRASQVACVWMIGSLAVAAAACGPAPRQGSESAVSETPGDAARDAAVTCTPIETREPNAPEQEPAFPGQTRACAISSDVAFDVVVLARGLVNPWAVEPLPGGDLLVTEKPGRLRIVSATGDVGQPISGVPSVDAAGQGGLLDVALSPAFASDRRSTGATPSLVRMAMERASRAECSPPTGSAWSRFA